MWHILLCRNNRYGEMVYMDNPNEFSPVSESAYCGAGNVHTILLHTSPSSKLLSIFPAVPSNWRDVGFHQLRAGGGLLVSANRTGGVTKFVRLFSATGGDLKLRVVDPAWDGSNAPPSAIPSTVKVSAATGAGTASGEWALKLKKNGSVILYMGAKAPELTIAPLAGNVSEYNWCELLRLRGCACAIAPLRRCVPTGNFAADSVRGCLGFCMPLKSAFFARLTFSSGGTYLAFVLCIQGAIHGRCSLCTRNHAK